MTTPDWRRPRKKRSRPYVSITRDKGRWVVTLVLLEGWNWWSDIIDRCGTHACQSACEVRIRGRWYPRVRVTVAFDDYFDAAEYAAEVKEKAR